MQVSTLLARKLVLDVLKLYVRFNEGHHRSPSSMASDAYMSTGSLGQHDARIYSRASTF